VESQYCEEEAGTAAVAVEAIKEVVKAIVERIFIVKLQISRQKRRGGGKQQQKIEFPHPL
jgi:hypothetical protein